jgi:multiple sugar transport system permease protein
MTTSTPHGAQTNQPASEAPITPQVDAALGSGLLGGRSGRRPARRRAGAQRGAGRPGTKGLSNLGWVLFFLLPSAVPLVLFTLVPMVGSVWVSLHDWNLISPMEWVGLDNYRALLRDPSTRTVFWHTLAYVAGYLPLVYVGGLALAMALNRKLAGRSIFRAVYFLPVITSWVVVALVWKWLLNPSNGLVNTVLGALGLPEPGWWTDPQWALPSVILASAWKDLGFVMVILLAGLQAIPQDLYEAATVDGASPWRRFRHITLPLLSPSTFFVVVISLINGFQVFDQVFVMTEGGPNGASQVVVGQIYDLTFRYGRAGEASALSWLLFALILLITAMQIRGQKKWVHYA